MKTLFFVKPGLNPEFKFIVCLYKTLMFRNKHFKQTSLFSIEYLIRKKISLSHFCLMITICFILIIDQIHFFLFVEPFP